jgi:hypothetical protein
MKTIFNSNIFSFSKEHKSISTEISDMQTFALPDVLGIRSSKTNKIEYFCYSKLYRNADNEITHWGYEAMSDKLRGWKVTIFND